MSTGVPTLAKRPEGLAPWSRMGRKRGQFTLTAKKRAWAAAYVSNGGNATSAAKSAGYSHPNVDGARLVKALREGRDKGFVDHVQKLRHELHRKKGDGRSPESNVVVMGVDLSESDVMTLDECRRWLSDAALMKINVTTAQIQAVTALMRSLEKQGAVASTRDSESAESRLRTALGLFEEAPAVEEPEEERKAG